MTKARIPESKGNEFGQKGLFSNRTALRVIALAAYSVLLLILVVNHEYWFDEGQAWNIARDNDIAGIFGVMKYEGHPPLWHLILRVFTSLGCSWRALGLVSWGIMTLTAGIVLFALPIKPYLQAALLLSSGMLYTNSVISRVYCVIYLLLAILAALYPQRKKHPLLLGLVTALLANTHVCMCGLVGIIGIFMLIDFFKDFKSRSGKETLLGAAGLVIAGAGVILLIVPLLGSLQANYFAASKSFTFVGIISSFIMSFSQITDSGISPNLPAAVGIILSSAVQLLLIAAVILCRGKRRSLAMLLAFTGFYMVVSGVVWYTTPNRGALFIYTLVMIFIMGGGEKTAEKSPKNIKTDSRLMTSIIAFLKRLDGNADSSAAILFAVILGLSVPSGIKYAVQDLCGEFDPSKAAAEFIRENITDGTLLVSYRDDYSALMTYLPERKIYSLVYGGFYSYASHEEPPDEYDAEAFLKAAEEYSEVWFIDHIDERDPRTVYSNDNSIELYIAGLDIGIFEMTKEEFVGSFLS